MNEQANENLIMKESVGVGKSDRIYFVYNNYMHGHPMMKITPN